MLCVPSCTKLIGEKLEKPQFQSFFKTFFCLISLGTLKVIHNETQRTLLLFSKVSQVETPQFLAGIAGAVKITRPEAVLAPPTSILLVGKQ